MMIKEAVKPYYDDSHDQLKQHLYNFIKAYSFAKRLKNLKEFTPYAAILDQTAGKI